MLIRHPKTIIIRHNRENIKKCSLSGLETRPDCSFFRYPDCVATGLGDFTSHGLLASHCLLDFEGPPLSRRDEACGLVVLDATWRYADKMKSLIPSITALPKRSLPHSIRTAYPRRQEDCSDAERGLASIEALYIAYLLLGRSTEGLLDRYYWKEQFLRSNEFVDFYKEIS